MIVRVRLALELPESCVETLNVAVAHPDVAGALRLPQLSDGVTTLRESPSANGAFTAKVKLKALRLEVTGTVKLSCDFVNAATTI